jgi:hypothetical protein
LLFKFAELRCDFGFFRLVGARPHAERLVICFFFLEKLQNQLMVALLILAIDIFVKPEIVFEGFTNVRYRSAVENLVEKLKMNLRAEVQVTF